jgi:uncharacterized membrane protein YraQ (UPF0718 family)
MKSSAAPAQRAVSISVLLAGAALALLGPKMQTLTLHWPAMVKDGLTLFFSIIIEALPFVLLGSLVSAGIRRWVTPEGLQAVMPKNPFLALPLTALLGVFFPVCECGNLPVARQMMRAGMRPAQAVTLLLAAPILNPAVIISTWAAFRFLPSLLVARLGLGFLISVGVGAFFILRGDADIALEQHGTTVDSCELHHDLSGFGEELLELLSALAFGALIATVLQLVIPRGALLALGHTSITAIAVMMALAIIVSLCSTVDAFFALAFSSIFPPAALLAFLVVGPMIDFRSLALMTRALTPRAITLMIILVSQSVFLAALALHHFAFL